MMRLCAVVLVGLISVTASAQIRQVKLVIAGKATYELKGTDIIVVDTLVMMDSSRLVLNKLKPDNFLHAKVAIFHRGSVIDGKGVAGLVGRKGRTGNSPSSPCTDGASGTSGSEGTPGGRGTNISFYFNQIILKGLFTIDASGGDGGEGGEGGNGGGGGPGTRICPGGNGGAGGNGSSGGNGGDGGSVSFISPMSPDVRLILGEKVVVRNYGGNHGLGGEGGAGGLSGLSPSGVSKMDGKRGKKGLKGKDGVAGNPGPINFQIK